MSESANGILTSTDDYFINRPIIHSQANFSPPQFLNTSYSNLLPNTYDFDQSSSTTAPDYPRFDPPVPSGSAVNSTLRLPDSSLSYVAEPLVSKDTPAPPLSMPHTVLKSAKSSLVPIICATICLEFTIGGWSPRPEDPFNAPAASGKVLKDSVIHWKLPIITRMFDNSQTNLSELHEKIYSLADECEEGDTNDKVSDILRASKFSVQAYINGHERYAKAKNIVLRKDLDVQEFFSAVSLAPKKVSGIVCQMDDPTKKARASEAVSFQPLACLQTILTGFVFGLE